MGLLDSVFGGGGSNETTVKTEYPKYVTQGGQAAVNLATEIAKQPYSPYGGQRVAGMSPNERYATYEAPGELNRYGGAFTAANQAAQAGSAPVGMSWLSQYGQYMNPYMKSAIDPAVREVGRQAEITRLQNNMMSAQRGAFGGSRTALLESENERNKLQTQGDLYAKGLAEAFGQGMQGFALDKDVQFGNRDLALRGADALSTMPGREAAIRQSAYDRLMQTGGLERSIGQAGLDTAYSDFLEQRDWPMRGLNALNSAVSSTNTGPTSTTQKTDVDAMTQLAGGGLAAAGLWQTFFA